MTPRRMLEGSDPTLTASQRHYARKVDRMECMAGYKSCLKVRVEEKTCCKNCIDRQKKYYLNRKANKETSK